MEERKPALNLTVVKKQYRLGSIGGHTLQEDLQSWWAKLRKKENPNLRIGQEAHLIGQRFMALNGIDLLVYQGETLGIIGSNGAGKSTLLKLISQVTAPTEGEIELFGRVTSMLEVGTGFHRELTGRENIYMNGAILGMKKAEIDAQLEKIIDFSEIRPFIDTPVKRYSSGMFVKLAFSVAVHLKSEIIIMDEVLAVGDIAFQKKCLKKMSDTAKKDGRTVLYVSHNMDTIRNLCDRCIVLDKGHIIYDGEPEQAIAVYMNKSIKENSVDMDLLQKSHSGKGIDTGIQMKHLTLLNKEIPVYTENETLLMLLTLQTTKPMKNLYFRLTLLTDKDVGLGTGWSETIPELHQGQTKIVLSMTLDDLAKGCFYASIGIYHNDPARNQQMLDHITRAFKLEITGSPSWNIRAHGYIHLPKIHLSIQEYPPQTPNKELREIGKHK